MKYANVRMGEVEAVWNKLGGEKGVKRFLRGETIVKKNIEQNAGIWKIVTIGNEKHRMHYPEILQSNGYHVSDNALEELHKLIFSSTEEKITLAQKSVGELGFYSGATYEAICRRAKEFGLELCPVEAGPEIRLEYKDQPNNECLRVATKPFEVSDGSLRLFEVSSSNNGSFWLNVDWFSSTSLLLPDYRLVFRLPSK